MQIKRGILAVYQKIRLLRFHWLFALCLLLGCAANSAEPAVIAGLETAVPPTVVTERFQPETLTIMVWQPPTTLNPHLTNAQRDWMASRIAYEPLASFDADGELIPFLAAEIPSLENGGVAQDGRSVTWRLRPDAAWSDGEPFTAADVAFTYDYITNPATGATASETYANIERVEMIDDHTVTVHFQDVTPGWFVPFVGIQGLILPEHVFAPFSGSEATSAPANMAPVGTGPYRFSEFRTEEVLFLGNRLVETIRIIYEPNPFYWAERDAPFDQVILRGGGTVEEAARLVLETGDVDFSWNLQAETDFLSQFENSTTGQLVANFGSRVERIQINLSDPGFSPVNEERSNRDTPHPFLSELAVRQALSLAVNREAIAALYGVAGRPTSNLLVSPANLASPNTSFRYDPAAAAALLDGAGWVDSNGNGIRDKDGVEMRILFQTTVNSIRQATQLIVQDDLERLGIDVQIRAIEPGIFGVRTNTESAWRFQADLQELFLGNASPYPGSYMVQWTCDRIPQADQQWRQGNNIERYCNPAYDALYAQTAVELDAERRQALFIAMNDLLVNDDVVMIPLVHLGLAAGVSQTLTGVALTPWDADVWNIRDWKRAATQ